MKANERRIRALLKMFKNIDLFYVISIGRFSNSLQAEFNSALVLELQSLKFKQKEINISGYLIFTRSNIDITLT